MEKYELTVTPVIDLDWSEEAVGITPFGDWEDDNPGGCTGCAVSPPRCPCGCNCICCLRP